MSALWVSGQSYFIPRMYVEAGVGSNLSYFDVGGGSPGFSFDGNVFFDLRPSWRIGLSVGINRARGTDEGTANDARGFAYTSNLFDLSAKAMYIIKFKQYPPVKWKRKLEPRVFASLGVLQLQPIPNQKLLERSTEEYLSVAPILSGGFGLAYHLERDLSLVLEAGSKISTSDFLEGYTNTLFSNSRDMYHMLMLKVI